MFHFTFDTAGGYSSYFTASPNDFEHFDTWKPFRPRQKVYLNEEPWKQAYNKSDIVLYHYNAAGEYGLEEMLTVIAPGFHQQTYKVCDIFQTTPVNNFIIDPSLTSVDAMKRFIIDHLIDNALFPYPVEELV